MRFTVRSTDEIPLTPSSMKDRFSRLSPPSYSLTSVDPGSGSVAAVARGWEWAPNWREDQHFIERDDNGEPQITGEPHGAVRIGDPRSRAERAGAGRHVPTRKPGNSEGAYWEAELGSPKRALCRHLALRTR